MKKLVVFLLATVLAGAAVAQNAGWPPPAGAIAFLGVYNSVAPTMTNGQVGFAQIDANGNLNVNVKAGSGSGCAGTVGTPCIVAQSVATALNMTEANSASILSAVQGAIPPGTNVIGFISNDPCQTQTPTIKPFSITTATTTNIVTGTPAKKLYVCYLYMQTAAANNVAVISGTTGATCGANTAALVGGTTAANGLNNAANSGQALGNGGYSVMQVLTNNDDICIITSASTPLAGLIKYVVQ